MISQYASHVSLLCVTHKSAMSHSYVSHIKMNTTHDTHPHTNECPSDEWQYMFIRRITYNNRSHGDWLVNNNSRLANLPRSRDFKKDLEGGAKRIEVASHCSKLQHTATLCSTLQFTTCSNVETSKRVWKAVPKVSKLNPCNRISVSTAADFTYSQWRSELNFCWNLLFAATLACGPCVTTVYTNVAIVYMIVFVQ